MWMTTKCIFPYPEPPPKGELVEMTHHLHFPFRMLTIFSSAPHVDGLRARQISYTTQPVM